MLYGDFFKDVIFINADAHPTMHIMKEEFHGALAMVSHSLTSPVLYLAAAGVAAAWLCTSNCRTCPLKSRRRSVRFTFCLKTNTTSTPCISTSSPKARAHWALSSGKSAIPPLSTTASSTTRQTGRRDCRSGTQSPNRLYLHLRRRYGVRRIGLARHDLLGLVQIKAEFQTTCS